MKRDDAFWAKVDKTGDCWLWTGARTREGYGNVRRGGKKFYTHRYVLILSGVEVGECVDHICHTPSCVRPDHLRSTTFKQNIENRRGANKNSRTGVRGVSWDIRNQRWRGSVKHNYRMHSKSFTTREAAEAWVLALRDELFTHSDMDRAV